MQQDQPQFDDVAIAELDSTLTVLALQDGGFIEQQKLSALPADAAGDNLSAAIALDPHLGRIYVSNRGHDSIATFAIAEDGSVALLGHVASGGRSPRFILIDEGRLLVAHEESGGVTAMPLDEQGIPGAVSARADVPGAAFLGVLR